MNGQQAKTSVRVLSITAASQHPCRPYNEDAICESTTGCIVTWLNYCYADFWLHTLQSLCWASATHHCCVGQQLNGNSDCTLERKSWQLLQIILSSLVRPCHVSSPQQDLHQHPVISLLDDTKKPTHSASPTTHMACTACRCASFSLTKRRMPMQKSLRSDSKTHRAPTSRMRQGPPANTQENVKPGLSPVHTDKCPIPSNVVDPSEPWLPKPGPVKTISSQLQHGLLWATMLGCFCCIWTQLSPIVQSKAALSVTSI